VCSSDLQYQLIPIPNEIEDTIDIAGKF